MKIIHIARVSGSYGRVKRWKLRIKRAQVESVVDLIADAKNRAVNTEQKRSHPENVDLEKV